MVKQWNKYGAYSYGVYSVSDTIVRTGKWHHLRKVYVGQIDSMRHKNGIGIMVYSNGTIEEGFYKHGHLYGKGRKIRKNGEVFTLKHGPKKKGANKHGYYWASV